MHGIISELESQGALPRSNSRVSSLATCCGPRLVGHCTMSVRILVSLFFFFPVIIVVDTKCAHMADQI